MTELVRFDDLGIFEVVDEVLLKCVSGGDARIEVNVYRPTVNANCMLFGSPLIGRALTACDLGYTVDTDRIDPPSVSAVGQNAFCHPATPGQNVSCIANEFCGSNFDAICIDVYC